MKIKVFTAFSGYDSQCLALKRLGEAHSDFDFDLVGWAEFDPASKQPIDKQPAVVAHNALFPQWADRNQGDISKVDWDQVPDFDVFTYSSPCQDFSIAGLQRGGEEGSGTRSSMLWECERAIATKHPKYLLFENVKALVSKRSKPTFDAWCDRLERYGYTNYWKVLNAKDYGVPQNRERVFMISILNDNEGYEFPKPFPLTIRLRDVLDREVDEKYYLSDKAIKGFKVHNEKHLAKGTGFIWKPRDPDGVASTLRANGSLNATDNSIKVHIVGELDNPVWHNLCKRVLGTDGISTCCVAQSNNSLQKIIEEPRVEKVGQLDQKFDMDGRIYSPDGCSPTIRTSGGGGHEPKIVDPCCIKVGKLEGGFDMSNRVYSGQGCSPSITATGHEPKILTAKRNQFGKEVRKAYESHEEYHKRGEMQDYFPREDGVSNTLTTVQKDNLLLEPMTICLNSKVDGKQPSLQDRVYSEDGISTAVTTGWQPSIATRDGECRCSRVEKMISDGKIPEEVCYIDAYNQSTNKDVISCIRSGNRCLDWVKVPRNFGPKGLVYEEDGKLYIKTNTKEGRIEIPSGSIFDPSYPNSKTRRGRVQEGGTLSPTLTTSDNLMVAEKSKPIQDYRIRKLTERECFRLMGLKDEEIQLIQESKISKTQQYKIAGNSIVVDVLYYLFDSLFYGEKTTKREKIPNQEEEQLTMDFGEDFNTPITNREGRHRIDLPSTLVKQIAEKIVSTITNS